MKYRVITKTLALLVLLFINTVALAQPTQAETDAFQTALKKRNGITTQEGQPVRRGTKRNDVTYQSEWW